MKRVLGAVLLVLALASVSAAGAATRPRVSALDRHFLVAANQANWFGIVSGVMAKNRGVSDLGRTTGQQVADQHRVLEATLEATAARLRVGLPKQLSAPDHWALHAAGELYGTTFDQQYAQLAVAHEVALIADAKEELRYGASPLVKSYARSLLATLGVQLQMSRRLASSGQ